MFASFFLSYDIMFCRHRSATVRRETSPSPSPRRAGFLFHNRCFRPFPSRRKHILFVLAGSVGFGGVGSRRRRRRENRLALAPRVHAKTS